MTTTVSLTQSFSQEQRDKVDPFAAKCLIATIACNVNNARLSDAEFRTFIANSIEAVMERNPNDINVHYPN